MGFPIDFSRSILVLPAISPPLVAESLQSLNPMESFFCVISVVAFSPIIVRISSQSFMWSRRFSFSRFLSSLYSCMVFPNVAMEISFVKIAYSFSSSIPRLSHSSVGFCLIAIPLILLSIHSFE